MNILEKILYDSIYLSTPIILCTLGGVFAYKANVLNIALEGMMLNAAFVSVLLVYLTGSVVIGITLAVVTTIIYGLIFSYLSISKNGNVIIIGLGINLIVPAIADFVMKQLNMANISLHNISANTFKIDIPLINKIPFINGVINNHTFITYLTILLIFVTSLIMYKTKFGIYVRVVGENENSAISIGLNEKKYKYGAILIGTIMLALAGINLSLGRMAMYTNNMSAGRGFVAIAAIYCGQGKPIKSSLYAILFGVSRSLAINLSVYAGAASGLFDIIPYFIMVIVLGAVSYYKFKVNNNREYSWD